ncbi:flavin-binding monooxygenase-like domain-containing protein [Ditylenchus destructor]|uniref:Flavin-containing monooxygenase n=1 Tax=Ditylenchus destructor TaxID=166010 RepID=A0AAD4MR24_9BILA|nr:flavin-binding monooxygenase-like domain-containing protein [Ditylenchus destructor]
MAPKRIAIIGAGPSGMLLARAFKMAADKDPNVLNSFEIVCFERQSDWGGLWNFTWRTGLDENGEPVHCSMYRNLWTIGPKECVELADYSYNEHFGKRVPSFMPRAAMWDYLNGNMTASNIKHWFRFKHSVQLCWKFGSKSITISYRTQPSGQSWPEGIDERPTLEKLEGRNAYFKDGSVKEGIDAVILCTGYLHSFPFMESSLRLKTKNCILVDGLYKGVVFEENPQLFYIGMQDLVYSFPMFDAQAYYVRDIILGRIVLPPLEKMRQNHSKWQVREAKFHENLDVATLIREKILFQSDYVKEIMAETDYPEFDTDAINGTIFGWLEDRKSDIMGFRNLTYKSVISDTEGAKLKKKWIEQRNDSLEEFLNENSLEL